MGLTGVAPVVRALGAAEHVAVLTGAGVSAESGIPTFRDALTGLWARYRPEELATPQAFAKRPKLVWDWYVWRRQLVQAAAPNAAHRALARLETLVSRFSLITQNVDGLHQRAGSSGVSELHGNITRTRCSREGVILSDWGDGSEAEPPRCPRCDAFVRPDVVWFGEALPAGALEEAVAAARSCDVFLSVGTSNIVEPAASLPWIAAESGATVVVVNTSAEGQRRGGGIFHLIGNAAEVLPVLLREVWGEEA